MVGLLLCVAGIVVMLTPTATVPQDPSQGWWVAAYRFTNAVQGGMTLLVAAAIAAAAMLVSALQTRRRTWAPVASLALMFTGILLGVTTWFFGQADVPTSRVAIAPGQTIEAYPAIESGRAFKVMLPLRIYVSEVDSTLGKAIIELRKPGEDTGIRNDIFVGDPLDVNGFQIALIGMELDPRSRSAVLTSEGGIERRAAMNSKVRFVPDGPEYEVRKLSLNYLGVMGPAAEIADPDGDVFWVTQRDSALEKPLTDVRLVRLETAPVPVFAITKTPAGQMVPVAAVVFAIGMVMFLFVRERETEAVSEEAQS